MNFDRNAGLSLGANPAVNGAALSASPPLVGRPLIHLLVDDAEQAAFLSRVLEADHYTVQIFVEFEALRAAYEAGDLAAAIVIDMAFTEDHAAAIDVNAINAVVALTDGNIPLILISPIDDLQARLTAYRAGVTRYLHKPFEDEHFCHLLTTVIGRIPQPPYRVLLVDDDVMVLQAHELILRYAGMEVRSVVDPLKTLEVLQSFKPDVIVLDMYMPGANGDELAAVIKEHEAYSLIPILFLSVESDPDKQLSALNVGGDDFLLKPISPRHLVLAVTARARRYRQHATVMHRLNVTLYERKREHMALEQHALVSIADAAGKIIYANAAFCEISGYSREELLGKDHKILKSQQHSRDFYREMWHTLAEGKIWRGEVCNRRKDGELYWVSATITPFLDDKGKVYQYVSIRTDITALKQSQMALKIGTERLRRGQIYANIGTWDWNVQNGNLYWSERIGPLFGYQEGQLETSYDNFLKAVHPEDRQAVIDAVTHCVEDDEPYEIEHRVVWPDGRVRWLLERGAVMRDEQGKPLQMLGVVQDVDDRKQAELALAERERQLREAQTLARIGHWSADLRSGELNWSDEIYRIFGYQPGSFAPSVAAFNEAVHPDDRAKMRASENRAAETGLHDVVHRIVQPNGNVRYVHELARVELDASGKMIRMVGTVQDITEQVVAEQDLITARETAERANRAKSDFLSSMSHELRTPMNAIIGFAQMLEYDGKLDSDQQDNVHEILKASRHLLDLINEVLDLAKIESGRVDLSLEPVEVAGLAEECQQLILPLVMERHITLTLEVPANSVVRADRVRLKQVLLNLLSNAVKYNRENGWINLTVLPVFAGRQKIAVSDSGIGIAADRLAEVFQPFNRLDAEFSEMEGTGIGLTITQRLVDLMGGDITIESQPGCGSTFTIEFPVAMGLNEIMGYEAEDERGASAEALSVSTREYRVLCIDDNPANLKLLAQILGMRRSIRLLTAHAPDIGIELALAHRPDLILLDINMPGMDGYQVLEVFKSDAYLKNTPVIAVTANAMPRDIERGIAAGFIDYVTKPIDIERFLHSVDVALAASVDSSILVSQS